MPTCAHESIPKAKRDWPARASLHSIVPTAMINVRAQTICPSCGFTEEMFAKTFNLGCSHCYETFAPQLTTFLPKLHRDIKHVGKVPRGHDPLMQLRRELAEIETNLTVAHGVSSKTDELLDRWQELSLQLAKSSREAKTP